MSVTAAKGFTAAGVAARISKLGPDLALVAGEGECVGAGMFTTNRVQAAPVVVSKEHLERAQPRAVVINSGNANAATGEGGLVAARATAERTAHLLGLQAEEVLVLSTGVIGVPLPVERVLSGVEQAAAALSPQGGADAAKAILTTDTCTKEAAVHADAFSVGGMAKGSGMIHPNLATMLAVVTTDYPLEPGEPLDFLRPAVAESFNSISVDGECSTNDAVVLLSSAKGSRGDDGAFAEALRAVCAELARQIVADGEGATLVAEINVSGAASDDEAKAVAERVATSPLVKTALFGKDANWGRVLAAAGSAPHNGGYAHLDPGRVTLLYNGTKVLDRGAPSGVEPDVDGAACAIDLDLGLGDGHAQYLTTDLSYDYVRINAEYRS
ncbi:MAG: bifunctional glutamate N-acetyltransferase/amino-acid acetyltransferase ArgJ [Gaiellaceae bacterium]